MSDGWIGRLVMAWSNEGRDRSKEFGSERCIDTASWSWKERQYVNFESGGGGGNRHMTMNLQR